MENRLFAEPQPTKLYYVNNPVFRYEAAARELRSTISLAWSALAPRPSADELIVTLGMLRHLGLSDLTVNINPSLSRLPPSL